MAKRKAQDTASLPRVRTTIILPAMQRTSEYVNAQPTQSTVTRLRPTIAAAAGE